MHYSEHLWSKQFGEQSRRQWDRKITANIVLVNVLYSPTLGVNLISIPRLLLDQQYKLLLENDICKIYSRAGNLLLSSKMENRSFRLENMNATSHTDQTLNHLRMGHINASRLKLLVDRDLGLGQCVVNEDSCEDCHLGKQHRLPFTYSSTKYNYPLELIHTDICGPLPLSYNNYKYFIIFIDQFIHYTVTYPLHQKSEASEKFKIYVAQI
jgi:hypothetical protein